MASTFKRLGFQSSVYVRVNCEYSAREKLTVSSLVESEDFAYEITRRERENAIASSVPWEYTLEEWPGYRMKLLRGLQACSPIAGLEGKG